MNLRMGTRQWTPVAFGWVLLVPALVPAQILPLQQPQTDSSAGQQIGVKMSIDLIQVKPDALGVPLRHGGVIPNSETVELNGRHLKPGMDYTMDNDQGMVYLLVPALPGQSVSVTYRYDASRAQASQ